MGYTDDNSVRYYVSAGGSSTFGTDIIGTDVITGKIADADSMIDMQLSKRYNVPFVTPYPPAIVTISKVMSAWFVLRSVYSDEIPEALAFTEKDYEKVTGWLNDLRDDKIDLPSGTSTSGEVIDDKGQDSKYYSSMSNYVPVFDVDDELHQQVDVDRLEDIAADRA